MFTTVVGISFGNSYSCIAFTNSDGKTEVLANGEGDRQIPSILAYLEGEEYHGNTAKQQLVRNRENVISGFRDLLGKNEPAPQYTLTNGEEISVPQVLKRHFRRLKESSEDYLGRDVDAIVLSYPTDFSHRQRKILVEQAEEAGLLVLQLLSEPAAAMLSSSKVDGRYLVLDAGGYRTDVAVVSRQASLFTILATSHAVGLGGNQLDEALINFFASDFSKKNSGIDPKSDPRALEKLRLACEETKKILSAKNSATISIESLCQGIDYHNTINRIRFAMISRPVIHQVENLVETVLAKCNLDEVDIDYVLMIGGTSSTSALQSLLSVKFPNIIIPENPSEAIALGCAIQGSLIRNFDREEVEEATQPTITNVPHVSCAIGVNVNGKFKTLVPEFAALPYRGKLDIPADPSGTTYISICEARKELVTAPTKSTESDEEEGERRIRILLPDRKIAEAVLKTSTEQIQVCLQCTQQGKAIITVREIGGSEAVRGEIDIAHYRQ